MTKLILLLLVLLVAPTLSAQQSADQKEVLAVLDKFFEGMTKRDTALSRATLLPGSLFYATSQGKTRISSDTAYLGSLARGTTKYVERIVAPTVLVHGDLAEVWAAYEFLIDGKRSHCGVDSFTFVREGGTWRMATAVYTIEQTGCPN